jgi:hypothetical protein
MIYHPGEPCQFDLFEPRCEIPVGYGQARRAWMVNAELGYSRALAGARWSSRRRRPICCSG